MTDNPSISARHDAAPEGIAAAGREIAAAVASLRPQIEGCVAAERAQAGSGGSGSVSAVTEAARVLGEHYPDQTSYDAGDLHGCHCGWEVPLPRSTHEFGDWETYFAHQAEALAKAGLLITKNENEGA